MSKISFIESGMTFGPFEDSDFFYIEKSQTYAKIQEHVKMAEFLLLRSSSSKMHVFVIEAKSSSPSPTNEIDFDKFINDIKMKFYNAFTLSLSMIHNRHSQALKELPSNFRSLNPEQIEFRLVLIINGHPIDWLPPIKSSLEFGLIPLIKTWPISGSAVIVLNEELAKEHSLIS